MSTVDHPDFVIDLEGESYQFYLAGVWVRDEGYYLSTDSGCSCPTPWENHQEDDLTGPLTWEQVKEELRSLSATSYHANYAVESVEEFIKEKEEVNGND